MGGWILKRIHVLLSPYESATGHFVGFPGSPQNGPKMLPDPSRLVPPKMFQKCFKNGPKMESDVKKYRGVWYGSILGHKLSKMDPPIFPSWRVLGPSWTDFNFFLPPSGRLLGPSGRGPGPPGGLPGASWALLIQVKRTILLLML